MLNPKRVPFKMPMELNQFDVHKQIDRILKTKYTAQGLREDAAALFAYEKSGHMFHYVIIDTPDLYEAFTKAAQNTMLDSSQLQKEHDETAYYLFPEDVDLINQNSDRISKLIHQRNKGQSWIVPELGTGTEEAIEKKTIPYLKAIIEVAGKKSVKYIGIDLSYQSAIMAAIRVKEALGIESDFRVADFNKDELSLHEPKLDIKSSPAGLSSKFLNAQIAMASFGSTLGNAENRLDGNLPYASVSSALSNYRRHLKEDDIFFISLDHNQDEETLLKAYTDPKIVQFSNGLLQNIQKVAKGLDISAFQYKRLLLPNQHLVAHGHVLTKDTQFSLASKYFALKQGQIFILFNCYKFPQHFTDNVFAQNAFARLDQWASPMDRMNMHVFDPV